MTSSDIPCGLALSRAAGWNQLDADWHRVLALEPGGCFIARVDDTDVGTVATCRFGEIGWVQLLLVRAAARGRGIGSLMLRHAIDHLTANGVRSIRLDATPLGQPLYERLGFRADFELIRYGGVVDVRFTHITVMRCERRVPLDVSQLESTTACDFRVTGTQRARLVEQVWREWPEAAHVVVDKQGVVTAYCLARRGAHAIQIGPCGGDEEAQRLFVATVIDHAGEPVYADIPKPNHAANHHANLLGLTAQRTLLRMTLGPAVAEQPDQICTSFGPEKG